MTNAENVIQLREPSTSEVGATSPQHAEKAVETLRVPGFLAGFEAALAKAHRLDVQSEIDSATSV